MNAAARWLGGLLPARQMLVLGALLAAASVLFAACQGDDSAAGPTASASASGGTSGGPEPTLPGPASKYVANLVDLNTPYKVDTNETYQYVLNSFAAQGPFKDSTEGEDLAKQWQIVDGFKVSYVPDGQLAGVLQGRYYITAEAFVFNQVSGADAAYSKFSDFYGAAPTVEKVSVTQLGNESSGFKLIQGTIPNSSEVAVFYRFVFRRGNVVGVVQTFGKNTALTIAQARAIAVLMDDRALGKRDASVPTALPTSALLPTVGP